MNNARRKSITDLVQKIAEIKADFESLRDEEQEYFDNMPEALQGGDKGQAAENAIDQLETAIDNLDEAISSAEGAAE